MSLCSLLYWHPPPMQDETFAFEHDMAHRGLQGSMSPTGRFSAMPYFIDPGLNTDFWHRDHQQAHTDVGDTFPGFFYPTFPVPAGTTLGFLGPAYNIEDYTLRAQEGRAWWTFQNHYYHLDAASAQNSQSLVFPFF